MIEKMIGLLKEGSLMDMENTISCEMTITDENGDIQPITAGILDARDAVIDYLLSHQTVKGENISFTSQFDGENYFVSYEISGNEEITI